MASILDDLKGILSAEDFAKLEGNAAMKARVTRGDELRGYYDGDEPPAAHVDPPPPVRSTPPPPGAFDLSAIERMFDSRLGKITETVDARIADVVKTRGDELVNNAVKIALQRSDELSRIYSRHERETGKPFDSTEFNTYLEKPEIKALGFRTITQAYEQYVAPQVQERTINAEVEKRVKAKQAEESGKNVPGTTPGPSVNQNILHFQKRTASGAAPETTGAGRAASALDKIMARRTEQAS
jgi:hypothetical protein